MISYDDMIRRITVTCNTAALVPRSMCFASRCPVQWTIMRTVSSRHENKHVPSRSVEKKVVPLVAVVEELMYRLVPSWKFICTVSVPSTKKIYTVPTRRDNFYLPSHPVVTIFIHRPVPSWQFLFPSRSVVTFFTVPSRDETKRSLVCTVPSRQRISHAPSRPVPSRRLELLLFCRPGPSRFSFFSR